MRFWTFTKLIVKLEVQLDIVRLRINMYLLDERQLQVAQGQQPIKAGARELCPLSREFNCASCVRQQLGVHDP